MLKSVTLIPTPAIQHNGTADFVYLVKPDSTVAVQNITTLTSDDSNTAVKGLNPNTTIATSGFDRLENGAHVKVNTPAKGKGHGQDQQQGNKTANAAEDAAPGKQPPGQTPPPAQADASTEGASKGTAQQ
jgi:multidrug efflux system membrane fusion protein